MQRQNVSIAALVDYPMFDRAMEHLIIPSMRELGFTSRTTVIDRPDSLLNESLRMRVLSDYNVFLIHKDYGARVKIDGTDNNRYYLADIERQKLNCPELIRQIHEMNPSARIIVTSGEYPDGIKSCLGMLADGYINIMYINNRPPYEEEFKYVINLLSLGRSVPEEIEGRGKDLQMFPEDRERFNFRFEEWNSSKGQNLNYA